MKTHPHRSLEPKRTRLPGPIGWMVELNRRFACGSQAQGINRTDSAILFFFAHSCLNRGVSSGKTDPSPEFRVSPQGEKIGFLVQGVRCRKRRFNQGACHDLNKGNRYGIVPAAYPRG